MLPEVLELKAAGKRVKTNSEELSLIFKTKPLKKKTIKLFALFLQILIISNTG